MGIIKQILVIDDEPEVRRMLCDNLKDCGYKVSEAGNGEEGLQALDTVMPDLIITDMLMPKKDGMEVIKSVRKNYPHIKVIAISGGCGRQASGDFITSAEELGADVAIQKPIMMEELEKVIRFLSTDDCHFRHSFVSKP